MGGQKGSPGERMSQQDNASKSAWVRRAVAEFEGPLLRYAARLLGNVDMARDVVQDTFLRLCGEDPKSLDGRLAAWLFTVCRNRAFDVSRKEQRMETLDAEADLACACREPAQSLVLEEQESAGQVLELLAALPANQQEAIRLKFQNGLSYREISEVTGLSVTNVGYLIHTGLKTIRQQLGAAAAQSAGE